MYKIMKSKVLKELEKKVSGLIRCGYIPSGNVSQIEDNKEFVFVQALYKLENKTANSKDLSLDSSHLNSGNKITFEDVDIVEEFESLSGEKWEQGDPNKIKAHEGLEMEHQKIEQTISFTKRGNSLFLKKSSWSDYFLFTIMIPRPTTTRIDIDSLSYRIEDKYHAIALFILVQKYDNGNIKELGILLDKLTEKYNTKIRKL